jgi:hypothetical protein
MKSVDEQVYHKISRGVFDQMYAQMIVEVPFNICNIVVEEVYEKVNEQVDIQFVDPVHEIVSERINHYEKSK